MSTLLTLALLGCANTMHGTIGGEDVGGADDAIFQLETYDVPYLGTYTGVALAVTGAQDACTGLDALAEVEGQCSEQCEQLEAISRDHLPPDEVWTLWIWLATDAEIVGIYEHGTESDWDGFGAAIERDDVSALRDFETCVAACEDGELIPSTDESSTGGELEITDYTAGEELQGEFRITFDSGEVEGHFSASWCEIFEL